jgi:hypothetical protein
MRKNLRDYAVEIANRWFVSLKTLGVALFDFVVLSLMVIILVLPALIVGIYLILRWSIRRIIQLIEELRSNKGQGTSPESRA